MGLRSSAWKALATPAPNAAFHFFAGTSGWAEDFGPKPEMDVFFLPSWGLQIVVFLRNLKHGHAHGQKECSYEDIHYLPAILVKREVLSSWDCCPSLCCHHGLRLGSRLVQTAVGLVLHSGHQPSNQLRMEKNRDCVKPLHTYRLCKRKAGLGES